MAELNASGPHVSPVLHAMQFESVHRETGGATMNVHTGKMTQIGDSGYAVGGAKSDAGERIPTHTESSMSLPSVLTHRERIRQATKHNPNSNIGSWQNDSGHVDYDASEIHQNRSHAERVGRARGEAAIFDMKHGTEIRTDN